MTFSQARRSSSRVGRSPDLHYNSLLYDDLDLAARVMNSARLLGADWSSTDLSIYHHGGSAHTPGLVLGRLVREESFETRGPVQSGNAHREIFYTVKDAMSQLLDTAVRPKYPAYGPEVDGYNIDVVAAHNILKATFIRTDILEHGQVCCTPTDANMALATMFERRSTGDIPMGQGGLSSACKSDRECAHSLVTGDVMCGTQKLGGWMLDRRCG